MDKTETENVAVENASPEANASPSEKPKRQRTKQPKKEGAVDAQAKYRVKGEAKEGESAPAEATNADARPAKKQRNRRQNNKDKDNQEPNENGQEEQDNNDSPAKGRYRVKGSAPEGEEEEEKVKGNRDNRDKADRKPQEKKEKPINTVYKNPFDFKEKKTFKSKWEEYRYGEWRRGTGKTFVTLETPIPELPEREIAAPDEAAFHKKQVEIENKIKETYKQMDDLKVKFSEGIEQKKAQRTGGGQYVPQDVKDKRQRLKDVNTQKRKIYNAIDEIEGSKGDLVRKREALIKSINHKYNTLELVPKGLKELKKQFEMSSGGRKEEANYIKEEKKLKESLKFIEEKVVLDDQLTAMSKKRKEVSKDLPQLIGESKELAKTLDEEKKDKEVKVEKLEDLDKVLDKINEKRKKESDEIEVLKKQRQEVQDTYYGSMIDYTKYQYLTNDIKWIKEMKGKLEENEERKQKIAAERKERQDRINKERDERKQIEVERKEREEARRARDIQRRKDEEESRRQTEFDNYTRLNEALDDSAIVTNPLFDSIEQCEFLIRYVQKQSGKTVAAESTQEEAKGTEKEQRAKDLLKKVAAGALQLAETKQSKEDVLFTTTAKKGKGKGK